MSPAEPPAPPPDPPWAPNSPSPDPGWPAPDAADRVFEGASNERSAYVPVTPLLAADPPKVGDFWLDARLDATPAGIAFTAHDAANTPALVILLSEGAAADAAARSRFAGEINALHIDSVLARGGHGQDAGRLSRKFRKETDDPVAPDEKRAIGNLAPGIVHSDEHVGMACKQRAFHRARRISAQPPARACASAPST